MYRVTTQGLLASSCGAANWRLRRPEIGSIPALFTTARKGGGTGSSCGAANWQLRCGQLAPAAPITGRFLFMKDVRIPPRRGSPWHPGGAANRIFAA